MQLFAKISCRVLGLVGFTFDGSHGCCVQSKATSKALGQHLPLTATTEPLGSIPPSVQPAPWILGKVTGSELMPQAPPPHHHHISVHSVETLTVNAGLENPPASPVCSWA